ncbi:DUF6708 domain-containing protein [Achromobacter sp. NFACC18-2]|uniref:DUF6708 domain-containing protein n=1 Tax=Achromobacter sp. NFACC18-2 TaxID=1564112 RepID=UPI0008C24AE4|nr:DUF6708 domain-containing protein [Achromobacter sp. NFACC18-2]SEI38735.1 hypothetical protein SAMN03159494_00055 [Achromobacter sp. NFACC18-2]
MTTEVKLLPQGLRRGGTPLRKDHFTGEPPRPDGVRRINNKSVEIESYANFTQSGAASAIGLSIVGSIAICSFMLFASGTKPISLVDIVQTALYIPLLPAMISVFYFAGGTHRSRGAFIRIHRGTRKLYFIYPRQKRLHVLDWDQLEVLAGYIPIVSASGYTSRHPLYLIGVDYTMDPPTEICAACGNLGLFDGDRSAKALWSYLQAFMAHGPEGLPEPAPLPLRQSRNQETLRPYRDWYAGLRRRLAKPYGWLKAPITIPLWLGWLLINAFPESVEAFIQYNVPYAPFPKEIDRLCGFDDKRTPVIRVNGERIEP